MPSYTKSALLTSGQLVSFKRWLWYLYYFYPENDSFSAIYLVLTPFLLQGYICKPGKSMSLLVYTIIILKKIVASQECLCLFNDLAIYMSLSPPLDRSDLSRFWLHWIGPLGFIFSFKTFNLFGFQIIWELFQKQIAYTKFDIYVSQSGNCSYSLISLARTDTALLSDIW